ncbi:unnamed protein product [Brassicogethes aeneus]|uniref:Choline transporter-like protein n=1 Tax=Brassicogethes aeneus TaxID=1431903 RepID=A0A9P0B1Y0_BRAAE|nr:unnamed protein product [Brassicogethes aeneus]
MTKSTPTDEIGKPIPYDPDFKGPLKNRSCTDIICLLLFAVFIVCWVLVGIFAIKNGDPELLFVPRDSLGRRCGLDHGVEDKKYLLFYDLTKCLKVQVPFTGCPTKQICVKSCPDKVQVGPDYDSNWRQQFCDVDCPPWVLPSKPVEYRCIPFGVTQNDLDQLQGVGFTYEKLTKAIKQIKAFSDAEQVGQVIVKDVINSWWKILIGIGVAVFVCLLYIFMLRFIAGIMVWLSILGVIALLVAGVYFSHHEWKRIPSLKENETKKRLYMASLVICSVILAIVLLVILFLRKRIVLAIALIKEGSKAVSSVTSVLVFPIVPWILQIGVIAYALVVCLYLATTGEPIYKYRTLDNDTGVDKCNVVDQFCNPGYNTNSGCICKFIGTKTTAYYKYAQAYNVFGFFWLAFFVSALSQMILAGVFAQWYWTFKKRNLPFFAVTSSVLRTLRYHIGTLAFGSLLVAICRMIRVMLEYIDHKLKKYDNPLTKAILCCMKCFFWCLEKFLKFINKNAYIMCAIHGKNFCASAKDAFLLLMRNIVRVFILDKVTDFLFFLSKLLITIGVGALAYVCFVTDLTTIDNSNIQYGFVPVVMIMIITYLISSIFFNVYSMAVDTLFLCFLEDCERNDGSAERPYFMSKNLMNIFNKKNKQS